MLSCLTIFRVAERHADADLWEHVKFGLDLLNSGRLLEADPHSYVTGSVLWMNHEWLSEAIIAAARKDSAICQYSFCGLEKAFRISKYSCCPKLRPLSVISITALMGSITALVKYSTPNTMASHK